MFDIQKHEEIRQTEKWGSFGKNGDEPLKYRLIKDLSDDHLKNIISFIEECFVEFNQKFNHAYPLMCNEIEYRKIKNISVPDYIDLKKLKFGR